MYGGVTGKVRENLPMSMKIFKLLNLTIFKNCPPTGGSFRLNSMSENASNVVILGEI
jgi:hypothetical protein